MTSFDTAIHALTTVLALVMLVLGVVAMVIFLKIARREMRVQDEELARTDDWDNVPVKPSETYRRSSS